MTMMNKAAWLAMTLGVSMSAAWAAGGAGTSAATTAPRPARNWWSYEPVRHVALPEVKQGKWVRKPVDAFVLAKLEEKGLKPSPEADRAAFIRRATLDLWGVIPTPEDVNAFVNDRSANAYEKLVDRLLASPHYGERQARRWLDLARYADTGGYSDDETRNGMWRYREYVINAFNADVPYDRFVREQIAGDEIRPGDQDALIATGFLRSYPDAPDHRDMVLKKLDTTTDMTDTVGTVFLAQTIGCARCHDHKADRISQKEYYQLQAFFANSAARDDLPVTKKGPAELAYESQWARWKDATADLRARIAEKTAPIREDALDYAKGRFFEDGRASLHKPQSEWTPTDRWMNNRFHQYVIKNNPNQDWDVSFINYVRAYLEDRVGREKIDKTVPQDVREAHLAQFNEFNALTEQLKTFNSLKPSKGGTVISGITDLGTPDSPPTHLLFVGNHEKPLEEVQPAFPAAITPGRTQPQIVPGTNTSGRRTALANWIASPDNPLTARVFVNRIWAQYFGNGIVTTVSDFGRAGQKPSHPELLDYLAKDFVANGWSVKHLHREILLSSVYRQSSAHRADAHAADPENRLLAVFPRKRMEAEEIRDSLLAAAGLLDQRLGGESVYPPIPDSVMKQSTRRVPGFWPVSKDPHDQNRRSLYVFTRRSVPYPMLDAFDMASPQLAHSVREVSTTPQQALTLFNNDLVYQWSQSLAGRVIREAGKDESARLDRLYRVLYSRAPDKFEKQTLLSFLEEQERSIVSDQLAGSRLAVALPMGLEATQVDDPVRLAAFVDLTHTLANSNEFTYRY